MREVPEPVKRMMDKYGKEFRDVFGVEVNKFAGKLWMVGIADFDIVKFNDFMIKRGYEENVGSLADYIEMKYGKRAKELIEELLGMEVP